MAQAQTLAQLARKNEQKILDQWIAQQLSATTRRADLMKENEMREQSREFLKLFLDAMQTESRDIEAPAWKPVKEMLSGVSRSRAVQGFSPSETAMFVFSLKEPLFTVLKGESTPPQDLIDWQSTVSLSLDKLGLFTFEVYQKSRESVIVRQQAELLELSTPVVQLWDNILALPLIGTLDSARTQVVMENLLEKIVETEAMIAIIDITGVPTVDTLVAQHLLKTVAAARLMGADCIISGIRPQIAQTIIHLGIDLSQVITKATLADALAVAMQRTGSVVTPGYGQRLRTRRHGKNSNSQDGPVPAGDDSSRHARRTSDDAAGGFDQSDRQGSRSGSADRYFFIGNRRFVYRPDDRQYCRHGAHARCRNGAGRHAAGGGDYFGRIGHDSGGCAHGIERR